MAIASDETVAGTEWLPGDLNLGVMWPPGTHDQPYAVNRAGRIGGWYYDATETRIHRHAVGSRSLLTAHEIDQSCPPIGRNRLWPI